MEYRLDICSRAAFLEWFEHEVGELRNTVEAYPHAQCARVTLYANSYIPPLMVVYLPSEERICIAWGNDEQMGMRAEADWADAHSITEGVELWVNDPKPYMPVGERRASLANPMVAW